MRLRLVAAATCLAFVTSCATPGPSGQSQDPVVAQRLKEARSPNLPVETRAAHYLDAAALAASQLGPDTTASPARDTYNAAAAELTILLKSAEGGRLWNRSLTLNGRKTFRFRLQPGGKTVWAPDYFTDFKLPREMEVNRLTKVIAQPGIGGSLVGVRTIAPKEQFAAWLGVSAPVTATLNFQGSAATLALQQPAKQPEAPVEGKRRPLAADYSAPMAFYRPQGSVFWIGLMGTLRSSNFMDRTGLYFLQPYDPDRIPVIFIHGLVSTPFTWMQTINELQADPEMRARYQFWVFYYPTGNPPAYSGLLLREEMAKVDKTYPNHRGYVLVGHSMGGLLARMQVSTVTPALWKEEVGGPAKEVLDRTAPDSVLYRSMIYRANPRVDRVVFVCTPHRGSKMAAGGLGRIARSLISLPLAITAAVTQTIGNVDLTQFTGASRRLPNSITGLAPSNPGLKVLNRTNMPVPYHSIIGDRGKGDSPNSTDGVVPYWSSHLDGAKSERIVPGPHSSLQLPETVTELDRILRLHADSRATPRQVHLSQAKAMVRGTGFEPVTPTVSR